MKLPPVVAVSKLENIQVMVLDGSARAADLLRGVFVKLGFENITVVTDGYEGIRMLKRTPVHLIFADWELRVRKRRPIGDRPPVPSPDDILPINGTDFVRRLRQSPHSPNPFVPVVLIANENSADDISKARDAGANEVITKPLDVEEICKRIVNLIDDTRYFITARTYKGPCRRRVAGALPPDVTEDRRKQTIRLVRRKEFKRV
jgi:two-component system chemotaxis response regulator CheY